MYLIWPAFYNDLTDSYRLSQRGRLRADLGGVYFKGAFILALTAAYGLTGFRPLLVAIAVQCLLVLHQFIPFLRLDGYYVVSGRTGVPDLFARIRRVLWSLAKGRRPNTALPDLKAGARRGVVAWVVLTVPALLAGVAVLLARLPVAAARGRVSFTEHAPLFVAAWGAGDPAAAAVSSLQLIVLLLPRRSPPCSGMDLPRVAVGASRPHPRRVERRQPTPQRLSRAAFLTSTAVPLWFIETHLHNPPHPRVRYRGQAPDGDTCDEWERKWPATPAAWPTQPSAWRKPTTRPPGSTTREAVP